MTDQLENVFGEELAEQVREGQKPEKSEVEDADDLQLVIANLYHYTDRSINDTLTILSKMDADNNPEVFEAFEDMLQKLQVMETFLESDHITELDTRE
jgi:ABC-type phosphate/phosphonate transport system substrate-binding protein